MKLNDIRVTAKKKKQSSRDRKRQDMRTNKFANSVGGDSKNYVREATQGELLPKDDGAAERMANELLSHAKGNSETAKQMAKLFLNNLLDAIDARNKQNQERTIGGETMSSRPTSPAAKGYEDQSSTVRPRFSEFA